MLDRVENKIKAAKKSLIGCLHLDEEQRDILNSEFDDLLYNCTDDILDYPPIPDLEDHSLEDIIYFLEANSPYKVIECASMSEQIKVEEFIEKLQQNPYAPTLF